MTVHERLWHRTHLPAERRLLVPVTRTGAGPAKECRSSRLLLAFDLPAQAVFLSAVLRRELAPEILGFEDRTDLELGFFARHRVGAALGPLERLFHRLHLPDPEAGDELLRLDEGTVDDALVAPGE